MKEVIKTFTGEHICYDADTHAYSTLDGRPLESATAYAEKRLPAFDSDRIAGYVAKKHDAKKADILEMWERNGETSRTFGTALHLAMEQWFRFPHELGTAKGYNLPKSQWLREAVRSFPLKDRLILPERVVADTKRLRAGRVDGLDVLDDGVVDIIDFKSDAQVEKNLDHHEIQLNFYREVIEASQVWKVRQMVVWSWDGFWWPHYIKKIKLEV